MYTIKMAFKDIVLKKEGFYSNSKNDFGGETLFGISRVKNPTFVGFSNLENIKKMIKEEFPDIADIFMADKINKAYFDKKYSSNVSLIELHAVCFYEDHFWNRLRCGSMTYESLAAKMFEMGINVGVHKASSILQESMNLLNYHGAKWGEVVEDGEIGPKTLTTLRTIEGLGLITDLVKLIEHLQAEHYISIARKFPTQETNLLGWLRRIG